MKICASPADTLCRYQRRLAGDQADPGAAPDAYAALCAFLADRLDPSDLPQAEQLLRQFLDQSAPDGDGRPTAAMDSARRVAVNVRAGKTQAEQYLFDQKFPGAARIRVVG